MFVEKICLYAEKTIKNLSCILCQILIIPEVFSIFFQLHTEGPANFSMVCIWFSILLRGAHTA